MSSVRLPLARKRTRVDDTGASSVEFALVVPIFLMLVFGIMYFGFIFAQNLALGNAARQGARAAVVDDGTTCGSIVGIVQGASSTIGLSNTSAVSVEVKKRSGGTLASIGCGATTATSSTVVPCANASVGDSIYVKATYSNTLTFPFAPPKINAGGEGEFRCEFTTN